MASVGDGLHSGIGELILASVPLGPWGRVVLVGANLMAWAEGVDLGSLASGISVALMALATVGIAVWERAYQQRRRHRQQDFEDRMAEEAAIEAAKKESLVRVVGRLEARMAEQTAQIEAARAERLAEEESHQKEVERLHKHIEMLMRTTDYQAEQIARLARRSSVALEHLGLADPGTGDFPTMDRQKPEGDSDGSESTDGL